MKRALAEYWRGSKAFFVIQRLQRDGVNILVDKVEANRRAAICIQCPFNKPMAGLGKMADSIILSRVGGQTTDHDAKLRNCDACSCPLRLAVHLTSAVLKQTKHRSDLVARIKRREKETSQTIHPDCWQLKIFN